MNHTKKIILIAAMAKHRVIGLQNKMPWHMPADLKHFKAVTMGKPVLMGRKTFESLGRALPGRQNLVISTNPMYEAKGAHVYTTLVDAMDAAEGNEVMVIGGGHIFEQMLPWAHTMHLTYIDLDVEGDAFFPEWSEIQWRETVREVHRADGQNPYDYTFITLERCHA